MLSRIISCLLMLDVQYNYCNNTYNVIISSLLTSDTNKTMIKNSKTASCLKLPLYSTNFQLLPNSLPRLDLWW